MADYDHYGTFILECSYMRKTAHVYGYKFSKQVFQKLSTIRDVHVMLG